MLPAVNASQTSFDKRKYSECLSKCFSYTDEAFGILLVDKEELGDENEVNLELMAWCRSAAGMTRLPSSLGTKSNDVVNNGIAKEDEVEAMGEYDILVI